MKNKKDQAPTKRSVAAGTPEVSIDKAVLSNGVTLLVDREPSFHSVAYSICLRGGSRDEPLPQVGLSHVLEHLLFKRTLSSSTLEIACVIDELGGDINAFTDTDSLCLHGTVPRRLFSRMRDFFTELLCEHSFAEQDLDTEKEVIRQEILEAMDDPAEASYTLFAEHFWPNSQLGLPVFGTLETLAETTSASLEKRISDLLQGERMIVCAVGDIDIDELAAYVEPRFGTLPRGAQPQYECPQWVPGFARSAKPVNQAHLVLGHAWPGVKEKGYLVGGVLASILGQGMSSRLFQLLRETHGLAYDVDADVDGYDDTSAFVVSAAVEKRSLAQALELIEAELSSFAANGVAMEEFDRAIQSEAAQLEMEIDDIDSRLWRAVESELSFGRYISSAHVLRRLESLTLGDAESLLEKWNAKLGCQLALLGDIEGVDIPDGIGRLCENKKDA